MFKASQFAVGESFDLLSGKRRSASDQELSQHKENHFLFTSAYNFSLIPSFVNKNCSQLHFIIFFPTKLETSLSKSQRGRIYFLYLSLSPPYSKKLPKATPRNRISALDDEGLASEL